MNGDLRLRHVKRLIVSAEGGLEPKAVDSILKRILERIELISHWDKLPEAIPDEHVDRFLEELRETLIYQIGKSETSRTMVAIEGKRGLI